MDATGAITLLLGGALVVAIVSLRRYQRAADEPLAVICLFCGARGGGPTWVRQHTEASHPNLYEDNPDEAKRNAWLERTGQR